MSLLFPTQTTMRRRRRKRRSHLVPIVLGGLFAASAIATVAYLLWPTWQSGKVDDPDRIPVSVETFDENQQPIDRIFLSISAHHDALSPDTRLRTIYPRYVEQASTAEDGLTTRPFRDNSPYSHEDLFLGDAPALVARCTRDAATPGMCLSERRIDGADLTFRFPRAWLEQWREVGNAMDRLTMQLSGPRG
jgi:hypothetical protein